jgi:DNA-binding PadR family transcriptional regulator
VARNTHKSTRLEVFSGKKAGLNRVILLVLRSSKQPLAKYDVYLQVHRLKGSRNVDSKTVYRRMDALNCEGWIAQNGTRPAKVQGESILYELTLKGEAALRLDEKNIEEFLKTATEYQLKKFIALF